MSRSDLNPVGPACFVGTKPFERALLRLSTAPSASLPKPTLRAHPLACVPSASPLLRVCWSSLHPALHPLWLSQRENVDAKVKPAQHERTALRADRKALQIESLTSIAVLLTSSSAAGSPHLVDFAGGSGPLALPLAALLPWCTVTIVDVKKRSLDLAEARAREAGLSNVRTWLGDIADFKEPFCMGLALHACGEASDLAMEACLAAGASFVLCPCCVGKLSSSAFDPYKFNATGDNLGRICYPRSAEVRNVVSAADYDAIATAGDFAEREQLMGPRGAMRRLCKCWLEHDRMLYAIGQGYVCHVCRMADVSASPKNHILLGWPSDRPPPPEVQISLSRLAHDPTLDLAPLLTGGAPPLASSRTASLTVPGAGPHAAAAGATDSASAAGGSVGGGLVGGCLAAESAQLSAALAASEWDPEELAETVRRPAEYA